MKWQRNKNNQEFKIYQEFNGRKNIIILLLSMQSKKKKLKTNKQKLRKENKPKFWLRKKINIRNWFLRNIDQQLNKKIKLKHKKITINP